MFTKGFKDQDQRKLSEELGKILQLEFVPDYWEQSQKQALNTQLIALTGISITDIIEISVLDFFAKIEEHSLSFENQELLGDILLKVLPLEKKTNKIPLAEKAIAIYEHAQKESNMFSFGLISKINMAKAYLP